MAEMGTRLKRKTTNDEAKESGRDWSSLLDEILIIIFDKLIFLDKLSAAAVCKGWKIPIQKKPVANSAWVLKRRYSRARTRSQNQVSCQFLVKEPYKPERPCVTRIINFPLVEEGVQLVASRNDVLTDHRLGWLLDGVSMRWSRMEGITEEESKFMSFFFYHPLDESYPPKFLPHLHQHANHFPKMATFSSHPMSLDCVAFVVAQLPGDEIEINTWRNGQHTWNKHLIKGHSLLDRYTLSIVPVDGSLYFLTDQGPCGSLATFDSSNGACRVTSPSIEGTFHLWTPRLAKLGGELLVFCRLTLFAYRHDSSTNTWARKFMLFRPVLHAQICGVSSDQHVVYLQIADRRGRDTWLTLPFCPLNV